jgi:hypothetical protein
MTLARSIMALDLTEQGHAIGNNDPYTRKFTLLSLCPYFHRHFFATDDQSGCLIIHDRHQITVFHGSASQMSFRFPQS